ncbi:hypothetical protein [Pseudanabaena sp. ABRG5-3]|uniref:hypothetical protein n=1 Tax=Pseudanabaena sp. ABRG5-3 TaxID=685565 RepID=UPI000F83D490|nr:hypothetical protein [Pseudanabaena sp. ABRG5-3]
MVKRSRPYGLCLTTSTPPRHHRTPHLSLRKDRLTRVRKLAIIVGESKAIGLAVKQVSDRQRYTYLVQRLAKFCENVVS